MTDRIADVWGTRTPHAAGSAWPVRVDEYVEDGIAAAEVDWVRSACVLCSNGCGMDIGVHSGRIVGVRGRAADRVNHGGPVSKQPLVKLAAVQVTKLAASDGRPAAAPTTTSSDPVAPGVPATVGGGGVREMVEEEA